jgi:glycosyltransferase involved in cell wall biosynthesis
MKIITIAHGHPSLHKGGGEVAAYSMHHMLREEGHQSVYVGWGGAAQSANGGSLTQVGEDDYMLYTTTEFFHFSSTSKNLRDALEALLNNYQPDAVHLHHYIHVGIEAAALIKQISPKTRVILTLHEYLAICANNGQLLNKAGDVCEGYKPERCNKCFPNTSPASFFMREVAIKSALSFVDHFISPSEFLAKQYVNWGIPIQRISAIENPLLFNGIDLNDRPKAPKAGQKWKLGFFGQINYYKGLDIILKGIKLATSQGVEIEIGIHGTFSAVTGDEYITSLKELISSLGDKAKYHGAYKQNDVQTLMQQYHWVIMGSRWYENSPVVIQEAISSSTPMIVPNHGGMTEKVSTNGLMYEPGSPQSLSNMLTKLNEKIYIEKCDATLVNARLQNSLNSKNFSSLTKYYTK